MRPLFDPGLQPERTELAWRRTALAIAVGSLVAARLLPSTLDQIWWMVPGLAGTVFAAVLWSLSRRRHERQLDALHERTPLPGGLLLLSVAVFATAAGLLGLVLLFL